MAGKFNLSSPEFTVLDEAWNVIDGTAGATVRQYFKHYYRWQGAYDDGELNPPHAKLPALRIQTGGDNGAGWISTHDHEERFALDFMVWSPGWHLADLYGLVSLVRAVWLSRATRQAFKTAASVEVTEFTTGPVVRGGDGEGRFLKGTISMLCRLRLRETA